MPTPLSSHFLPLLFTGCTFLLGCGMTSPENNGIPATSPDAAKALSTADDSVRLRKMGPEGLAVALEAYDRLPEGAAKRKQALVVDRVAMQRYATSSRLYWYTDLDRAQSAAEERGLPILSLRLLGHLDEDFSCANSRLFRTVLYANQEVASYMRDHFVLHWSSEREVPKVSIDFGQGRVMKSTVAGNSAHYILTSDGRPLDVVPGLYSASAFVDALKAAEGLAQRVQKSPNPEKEIKNYHNDRLRAEVIAMGRRSPAQQNALAPYRKEAAATDSLIASAEMLTMGKMMIELPLVAALTDAPMDPNAVRATINEVEAISIGSRELIAAIGPTDWGLVPSKLTGKDFDTMLEELATRVAGDTLINQHGLHPLIHTIFVENPSHTFEDLNTQIYSAVFKTPADDPWLGFAQPEGFTGLPGDGLSE